MAGELLLRQAGLLANLHHLKPLEHVRGEALSLCLLGFAVLSSPAGAAERPALRLDLPVACDMARLCAVQNYFDHDPGPGARDYACGRLTYDGHQGTDFRVPDLPAMTRGVAVIAAAPGRVRAIRDGMADRDVREPGAAKVEGREAGNAVVIDHGGGWETQYSHLRRQCHGRARSGCRPRPASRPDRHVWQSAVSTPAL